MGTTLDAMKNDPAVKLGITVQIEGFPYILCDAQDATEQASALAAYDGADTAVSYLGAIRGLEVDWENLRQEIDPWSAEFTPTSLRLTVFEDLEDTLGKIVFKSATGDEWALDENLDTTETAITVANDAATGLSAGDIIYSGVEAMKYASESAPTINVSARGVYAPFKADTETYQRFAHVHKLPLVDYDVAFRTKITTAIRRWIGRWVAVRLHRVVGQTWDAFSEASLEFAGTIRDVRDTANHSTEIICEDARAKLNNTYLLQKQWKGRLRNGLMHLVGWTFDIGWKDGLSTPANGYTGVGGTGESLTGVASGAGGNEFNAKYYSAPASLVMLQAWMISLSTYTGPQVAFYIDDRTGLATLAATDGLSEGDYMFFEAPLSWFAFMGFDQAQPMSRDTSAGPQPNRYFLRWQADADGVAIIQGTQRPFRAVAFNLEVNSDVQAIILESAVGDWLQLGPLLPEPFRSRYNTTSNDWGLVRIQGHVFVVLKTSATTLAAVYADEDLANLLNAGTTTLKRQALSGRIVGIRYGDSDQSLFAEQVVFIEDTFTTVIASLFASTDGAGYNHATYDQLGGCGAGIPWELLGDEFVQSLDNVAALTSGGSLAVYIDKPTLLTDLVGCELATGAVVLEAEEPLSGEDLVEVAYHEAGHAVAGVLLGRPFDRLTIAELVRHDSTGRIAVSMVVGVERSEQAYREVQAQAEAGLLDVRVFICRASGMAAQSIRGGRLNDAVLQGGIHDMQVYLTHLAKHAGIMPYGEELLRGLYLGGLKTAIGLLSDNWEAVEVVAELLIARTREASSRGEEPNIPYAEVAAMVEQHRGSRGSLVKRQRLAEPV